MDTVIVADVMDDIAERLDTISGLRVLPYDDDADDIQLPAGLISLSPKIDYSKTYGPTGMVKQDFIITILVSLVDSQIRRKEIAPYGDSVNTGGKSVKAVLESGTYTAFDVIFVHTGMYTILTIAENTYKAFIAQGYVTGR